ncbi:MAG TPA: transglutaminase family protein [Roseimicrobium sp.]|nr:transglutaminase family protein [Roseimicrobium sp.]
MALALSFAPAAEKKTDRKKVGEKAAAIASSQANSPQLPLPASGPLSIADLSARAKPSLVVVSQYGRDQAVDGVGTGFVIDSDGLIATSFHVIGEGRRLTVQFADGKKYEVTEVRAWDRKSDLTILKIDAKGLPALPLGDSDDLKQGTEVVALGNPAGMDFSVVLGVVSARRDFETAKMIQLAIPVEPGNSGGPLLDLEGRVHGVMTMKSAVTRNLGFAMPINEIKPLIAKPNPVPMSRWLTIGVLNPNDWKTFYGARWSQKSGRILVEGAGEGFGGRSLCFSTEAAPKPPYDIAVSVQLDDETGAAGIVFAGEGKDRHLGFYPSNGRLRITRFEGANVFSWQVLKDFETPAYKPEEWNHLRVRVQADKLSCFVNDLLVAEVSVDELPGSRVGLAKFRDTKAEFKGFAVASDLISLRPSPDLVASVEKEVMKLPAPGSVPEEIIAGLELHAEVAQQVLQEKAKALDQAASKLREAADKVHRRRVETEIKTIMGRHEEEIDLFRAALWLAKLDNPELDPVTYQREIERMAKEIRTRLAAKADSAARVKAVSQYLFVENGFHGSRSDYYNRANSYISDVMDDREGIPISLSVLFMELCRRVGADPVVGVPLPGHFVVRHEPVGGKTQLIDVFDGGKPLTREDAELIAQTGTKRPLADGEIVASTKKEILLRMIRNLVGVSMQKAMETRPAETGSTVEGDPVRYLDLILAIEPNSAMERWSRAAVLVRKGDRAGAKRDLEWLLQQEPPGIDLERVAKIYRSL